VDEVRDRIERADVPQPFLGGPVHALSVTGAGGCS
jgi:hypothetical protein